MTDSLGIPNFMSVHDEKKWSEEKIPQQ